MQGYNALKYFSTIVAVCARIAYSIDKGVAWKLIAFVASIIAAIVSTYWDIVLDWGLLQRHSKNRWLRDKLLVPYKSVYFIAIVSVQEQRDRCKESLSAYSAHFFLPFFAGSERLLEISLDTNCDEYQDVWLS